MKIQILGTGCPKCRTLTDNVYKALQDAGVTAEVEKVEDIKEIMKFNIMITPGLAIDGEVVSAGKVLTPADIVTLITSRLA